MTSSVNPYWSAYRGNSSRKGFVPSASGPELINSMDLLEIAGYTREIINPIVSDEQVFVVSKSGHIEAFNPDGSFQWNESLTDSINVTPVLNRRQLFVPTLNTLHAFTTDGRKRWEKPTGALDASPAVIEDHVLTAASSLLRVRSAMDGREVASFKTSAEEMIHSLSANSDMVLITTGTGDVYALNLPNLEMQWRVQAGNDGNIPAVLSGDLVVLVEFGSVVVREAKTGNTVWSNHSNYEIQYPPAVANGMLYVGSSNDASIRSLDLSDGANVWSKNVSGVSDPLVVDSNRIYAIIGGEKVVALNRSTGDNVWTNNYKDGSYLTGLALGSGMLYAFDTQKERLVVLS